MMLDIYEFGAAHWGACNPGINNRPVSVYSRSTGKEGTIVETKKGL